MATTEKKKTKVLIKPEKCTGCRVCQLECSFKYHKVFNPALSNIQIIEMFANITNAVKSKVLKNLMSKNYNNYKSQ